MLIGFDEVNENLLNLYDQNNLSHAILINGKKGIGKSLFAKKFIHQILGNDVQDFTNLTQHPDLLIIEREDEKKEITIDRVRKIKNFVNQTSAISDSKFILIDSACELNKSSANAILKILEEPNAKNYLFLISHNFSKILPTIKSRCNILNIGNLQIDDFKKIVTQKNPNFTEKEISFLAEIFDNSPALAIENGKEIIAFYQEFLNSLNNKILSDELIKTISKKEFNFDLAIQSFSFFIVRLLSFFNKIEKQLFFNEAEIFINISNYKSLKEIIDFCEKDFQKINKVKPLNLDKKLAVINFFNYFIS